MMKNLQTQVSRKTVEKVFVTGVSGSGKSTYVKSILKGHKRAIVFDPLEEYHEELGYPLFKTLKDLFNYVKANYNNPRGFKVSYNPYTHNELDRTQDLEQLAKFMLILQKPFRTGHSAEKVLLVIEEMNTSYPNRSSVLQEQPAVGATITRGRHYGVSMIGVDQSAVRVHTSFRDNVSKSVYFKQDSRKIQELQRILGKELALLIVQQTPHNYVEMNEQGEIKKGKNELC